MRLIDADALMEEFADFVAPSNKSDFADTPTWNDAVSLLGSAPTIEPKKGKWKEEIDTGERMLACSACGGRVFLETYETAVGEHGYRFCPYCGADMRGEG